MKNLILFALIFIPTATFAADDSLPAFPMSFWGEVTIDGVAAPVGSTVRVYEGEKKVGEVVVQNEGVYGYTDPVKQKLVVEESEGVLNFTIQSSSINDGVETKGLVAITYPEFKSSEAVNKDLGFTVTAQEPPVVVVEEPKKKSSGGGGGGNKNKVKAKLPATELVLGASTSTASTSVLSEEEKKIMLQKQLIALLSQLIILLQMKMGI